MHLATPDCAAFIAGARLGSAFCWFFWETCRRRVLVLFETAAKSTVFAETQRRAGRALVALRLAVATVGGGRAQVPQNALNDATVTAAVSHQRMRPVHAPATRAAKRRPDWPCWERALRAAKWPQRCGGVAGEKHACSLLMISMGADTMTRIAAVAEETQDAKTLADVRH